MSELSKMLAAAIGAGILLGATATQAQQPSLKMTLFGQPSVNNDAIWMALVKGYYQQEGLDVTYRLFPSGTTALDRLSSIDLAGRSESDQSKIGRRSSAALLRSVTVMLSFCRS